MTTPRDRDANLDLLRASAIATVVAYHMIQMSFLPISDFRRVASFGQYGVDLFFVLSGWLIGSLFWKEQSRFGAIQLWRFWARRWMRTIPPYLIALLAAWCGAYLARRQPFDWRYFFFVQNYFAVMPFFLVSWSLCIEEHFYVVLPLLLTAVGRNRTAVWVMFLGLIVAAPVGRVVLSLGGVSPELGFDRVASHLRMEGLLVGFLAAWLPINAPEAWTWLQGHRRQLATVAVVLLTVFVLLPDMSLYRWGLTILPLALGSILVVTVNRAPSAFASSRFVRAIALCSYSTYLTHALVIDVVREVMLARPSVPRFLFFPLALALISIISGAFYFAIERTSIVVRDRWIPRRVPVALRGPVPGSVAVSSGSF